jgi:hypothetical protein
LNPRTPKIKAKSLGRDHGEVTVTGELPSKVVQTRKDWGKNN